MILLCIEKHAGKMFRVTDNEIKQFVISHRQNLLIKNVCMLLRFGPENVKTALEEIVKDFAKCLNELGFHSS